MCESTAYLLDKDQEELVMEHVDFMEKTPEGVRLVNLFGEERVLKAVVRSLSLLEHKILLQPAA